MTGAVQVLLVEDNEADVLLVEEALVDFQPAVQLRVTRGGEEALEHLRACAAQPALIPRFVLLDANMPRMNAVELLTELRRDPHLVTLPVVVYSSSSSPLDARRVYQVGANAYVAKPVSLDDFMQVLRSTLRFWCSTVPVAMDSGDGEEHQSGHSVRLSSS
ncbi:response regulator [Deinococcus peraridilitoris]|uniref:CheY-like receiver domain-containing protein n=1 Tax=Deinococcus peraridilitoris (strain DSM 19664 / LMG 22246 / CIP 109416 / KR-200) TaxID=937777 RepID=L0A7B4_DEIPD|nr:response regulator [Deinococcus peraridilitoris]AFZ69753.1 CheY-like receiver domain-containing protein [Deinococcus peraridilitoris DSM 19664]